MKKITFLLLAVIFGFGVNAQTDPGSIKNNVDGKIYYNQSPGQISEDTKATGYGDNLYYSWEYGVEGETMTVVTTTKDYLGGVAYDGDNDGNQDVDENGKPLYYDSSSFLNVYTEMGEEFGGKTLTYTRHANDKTNTLASTSASTSIEVLAEKKPVAGRISTTQDKVRVSANIDPIVSDEEASEGYGTLTYRWVIGKIGSSDFTDLEITTPGCDVSDKTFADFGMVAGDRVKFMRYAKDELGTEVSTTAMITLLSSVAFTEPTTKYIVTAQIEANGPSPEFMLINGDFADATNSNVGVKLGITRTGGSFRNPIYSIVAITKDGRPYTGTELKYDVVPGGKYDIKYKIDPSKFIYSLEVKKSDSTNFVVLADNVPYYESVGGVNKIALTHYDRKDMNIPNFKVTPIQSISMGSVPRNSIYKFSATIQGTNRGKFYLLNNADGFTDADVVGFSNVGPNLLIEQGSVFMGTATGVRTILGKTKDNRLNNVYSDQFGIEGDISTKKFDIEYIIDPVNFTYTFKIKENGSSDDFTTLFENEPYFFKQQADDSYVNNEFPLTHYQASRITVENAKVEEVKSFALNVPESDRSYTFTATVEQTPGRNHSLFFLGNDQAPTFTGDNMGPVVSINRAGQVVTWEGWDTNHPLETGAEAAYSLAIDQKYDIKLHFDVNDFIYTFSIKKNGEDDSNYVKIVEFQSYYFVRSRGIDTPKEIVITNYYPSGFHVENAEVTMDSNIATLSDLTIDGTTVEGFSADKLTYEVVLEEGTTTVPTIAAISTDENANVVITDATELPGSTTVEVTAEDGETVQTYTINFTVNVNLGQDDNSLINGVYPNPTNGYFTLEFNTAIDNVEVYNVSGALVKVFSIDNVKKAQLNISSLESGLYFVKVTSGNSTSTTRIIKK